MKSLLPVFTLLFTQIEFQSDIKIQFPPFDKSTPLLSQKDYLSNTNWLLDFGIGKLSSQYTNLCIPALFDNMEWNSTINTLFIPSTFKSELKKCMSTQKLITLPLTLINLTSHQTILFFNQNTHVVELYDPQGLYSEKNYYNIQILHSQLKSLFHSIGFQYTFSKLFPVQSSEQYRCYVLHKCQYVNYCVSWVLWFLEFRLNNPHLSVSEINQTLSDFFIKNYKHNYLVVPTYASSLILNSHSELQAIPQYIQSIPLSTNIKSSIYKEIKKNPKKSTQSIMRLYIEILEKN